MIRTGKHTETDQPKQPTTMTAVVPTPQAIAKLATGVREKSAGSLRRGFCIKSRIRLRIQGRGMPDARFMCAIQRIHLAYKRCRV